MFLDLCFLTRRSSHKISFQEKRGSKIAVAEEEEQKYREKERDLNILVFLETRSRPTRERERERFCNEALTVTDFGAEEWLY